MSDLIDFGHILLHLCHPTPAPHHLQSCRYSAKTNLWCCKKFLTRAGFTRDTWYSRSQTSLDNTNFELFTPESTWFQQKIDTWFSEVMSHLSMGDFASEMVLNVSLPRSIWQSALHVWRDTRLQLLKEDGQRLFPLPKAISSFPWRTRHMGRAAGLCAATGAEAEGTSQRWLSGAQAADGQRVQELCDFWGFASSNRPHPASVPACAVLSWAPCPIPSSLSASVFWEISTAALL